MLDTDDPSSARVRVADSNRALIPAAAERAADDVDHRRLAAAPVARHGRAGSDGRGLDLLDGGQMIAPDVDLVPLAVERQRDALLVPVDVAEGAHLAVVGYPGGEIDKVHGDF